MKHFRSVATAACLLLLAISVWWLIHPPSWGGPAAWYVLMAAVWVLFGIAVWLVRTVPKKTAAALILLGGVALPLAAGFAPPRTSDDLYRYLWDGRVQSAGTDPYLYVPAAPELAGLRDGFLWPQSSAWCVPPGEGDLVPGCSLINRPAVHTIYPPVAQAYFQAVDRLSPAGAGERPIQLAAAAFAIAVTVLLLTMLTDPRRAALWAWCPLVALEAGNNAHLDVVAAFLTAAALIVAARAKSWRGTALGASLLGLAFATKLTPALAGPSLLKRRPLTVIAAAAITVAVVYVPHVLSVGPAVLGYLPEYLRAEGYATGNRFALLALALAPSVAAIAAVLVLLVTAMLVYWRSDPAKPWDTAVVMTGVFLLVSTPGYSWYAMLLVVLVAMSGRVRWLAVAIAGYVAQYSANLHLSGVGALRLGYGTAAVIVAVVFVSRRLSRRDPSGAVKAIGPAFTAAGRP